MKLVWLAAVGLMNVFGADDRVDVDDPAGPLAAVGRLDGGCSAVLVAPNLVLTAAHCVSSTTLVFRARFAGGAARVSADVARGWYGTAQPDAQRGKDWAVLELAEKVDGITPLDVDATALGEGTVLPFSVALAGYSGDRSGGAVLSVHDRCTVRNRDGERYLHDCDGTAGISGAPLLAGIGDTRTVVGLTVSEFRQGANTSVTRDEYSDDYANVAIAASSFAPTLAKLLDTVARGEPAPSLPGVLTMTRPAEPRDWTPIDRFRVPMAHGQNRFDAAAASPLPYNRIRFKFEPASCTRLTELKVAAITVPEKNAWESATVTSNLVAAITRDEFTALRIFYNNSGFAQSQCELLIEGARVDDSARPAPIQGSTHTGNWYCVAAPYGNTRVDYGWWLGPSVDYARYQALAACTQAYGAVCIVECRPR